MHFKHWVSDQDRAAFHEAGHLVAARSVDAAGASRCRIWPRLDGWDGEIDIDLSVIRQDADRYFVAVCGPLAEGKGLAVVALDAGGLASTAASIRQGLDGKSKAFRVEVPLVGGGTIQASATQSDYSRWLSRPLSLPVLTTALDRACTFLSDPARWGEVQEEATCLKGEPRLVRRRSGVIHRP
jgi:hypothetical protein